MFSPTSQLGNPRSRGQSPPVSLWGRHSLTTHQAILPPRTDFPGPQPDVLLIQVTNVLCEEIEIWLKTCPSSQEVQEHAVPVLFLSSPLTFS